MKLDLDKPLEIENRKGELIVVTHSGSHNGVISLYMRFAGINCSWQTDEYGVDFACIMPQVRNAKRVPKDGEWWMCEIDKGHKPNEVLQYSDVVFLLKTGKKPATASESWILPLYPMIQDPDYTQEQD